MVGNFYQPDLIVLHQNSNDISPNTLYTREIRYNIIYVFDGSLSVTYDKQNFLLKKTMLYWFHQLVILIFHIQIINLML